RRRPPRARGLESRLGAGPPPARRVDAEKRRAPHPARLPRVRLARAVWDRARGPARLPPPSRAGGPAGVRGHGGRESEPPARHLLPRGAEPVRSAPPAAARRPRRRLLHLSAALACGCGRNCRKAVERALTVRGSRPRPVEKLWALGRQP